MIGIICVVIGVALVLWGADRLTDGATALAQRMNIPQMVIGLTVVAMGTSMPEFFVSLVSAIKGTPDLAEAMSWAATFSIRCLLSVSLRL